MLIHHHKKKKLCKLEMEANFFNTIKNINITTSHIILNSKIKIKNGLPL